MKKFRNTNLNFNIIIEEHFEIVSVLGQNIKGYTGKYVVFDDYDFWQIKDAFSENDLQIYVDKLIDCKTKNEYNYIKWCTQHKVKEGSVIQFDDGKKGVILGLEYTEGCLKYSPIKKDGTVSKNKRYLYGNMNYKVISY